MEVSDNIAEKLAVYTCEIISWNKKMSLISKKDEGRIVERHITEAIITSKILKDKSGTNSIKVMDMGAGAGDAGRRGERGRLNPGTEAEIFNPRGDLIDPGP